MKGPLARILLRYGAAALVTSGILAPGLGDHLASDPDVMQVAQIAVGGVIVVAVEVYYWFARRWDLPR